MAQHVVVAGGGIAALEGVLALQALAVDRVRISVLTPGRHLTYRALSVAEPFDAREGPPVPYDALLLAVGARPSPALPGALDFAGPRDVVAFMESIDALTPGRSHAIVFAAVARRTWTLPLYELALMTAANGRQRGLDLTIELVTSESEPLEIFGREASAAVVRRLADAGVGLRTGTLALEFSGGALRLEGDGRIDADIVVALPHLTGPGLPRLPCDHEGFVPVDAYCRVRGLEHVWAVGDMTQRRLKQGGLAAQQADVAAADIVATVAGTDVKVRPYRPKLQGKLLTGTEPLFLERGPAAPARSQASSVFLWWPAHKVVGRHLGPYLESLGRGALRR